MSEASEDLVEFRISNILDPRQFPLFRGFARCMVFFLALATCFSVLSPHFLTSANLENVLSASAVIGFLALGATFVIASGGIDLSVASVMALSGTAAASMLLTNPNMPPWMALIVCLLTGCTCGLVTGVLIATTQAPSFIVTLGMLSVARAVAFIVSDGTPIYGLPDEVTEWGQSTFFFLPGPIAFLLCGVVVAFLLLHCTRFGTQTLILGDNPAAAEVMGIRVDKLRVNIFALCGAFSGVAGFIFMARTNAGDPTAGQNYELIAITAVVLGGAKLFGGEATVIGTLLGVLCLTALQNGLNLLAVSAYYQVLFVGLVLISAAMLERMGRRT